MEHVCFESSCPRKTFECPELRCRGAIDGPFWKYISSLLVRTVPQASYLQSGCKSPSAFSSQQTVLEIKVFLMDIFQEEGDRRNVQTLAGSDVELPSCGIVFFCVLWNKMSTTDIASTESDQKPVETQAAARGGFVLFSAGWWGRGGLMQFKSDRGGYPIFKELNSVALYH